MEWVAGLEQKLARSPRPGCDSYSVCPVDIDKWLDRARALRIKSIICLLSGFELAQYYAEVPGGLLSYYERSGFTVVHVPISPAADPPASAAQLTLIWREYRKLPPACLIHCHAGIDRTGIAVQFIESKLDRRRGNQDGERGPVPC